jgi:molecular chaperone GrpE
MTYRVMEVEEQEQATALPGDARCGAEPSEAEVERLREELASEREQGLRALAEFDNYRRRVRRESADAGRAGRRDLLLALLDVMDDFDRAVAHVGEASDAVSDGLRLIHQRLRGVLEANGVTSFESKGRMFDPAVHEGMSLVDSDEYESGSVCEEYLRGYLWDGELLRPARVIVAR